MNPGFLLIAVAPGLFWLWFFARYDVYRPAPRRLIAWTFLFGCLAVAPAAAIEWVFLRDSIDDGGVSLAAVSAAMLLVVGPAEEVVKFAVVRLFSYRSRYFEEPMDGLVYAAAASLRFASVENLFYVLSFGPEIMVGRAPVSTLAHVVFGSFWGYALGLHFQSGGKRLGLVLVGLAFAALVHAFFNIAVFTVPLLALVIVVVGALWVASRFRWGQRVSPFRYRRNYPNVGCGSCGRQIRIASRFCRFCGTPREDVGADLFCGFCHTRNRPDAAFCTHCGDRLVR